MTFAELVIVRHSGYDYDVTKPVPKALLIQLAQTAHYSPSSYNEQPWSFIFCDKKETPEAYSKLLGTLAVNNQKWAQNAPVLILVSANEVLRKNNKPNRWAQYDTGAAAMSLVYKAASLGLMPHEMGGFDDKKVRQLFSLPASYTPMAVIAIGYEQPNANGIQEKKRNPLSSQFFWGDWANGIAP
jgi:nitroreductase